MLRAWYAVRVCVPGLLAEEAPHAVLLGRGGGGGLRGLVGRGLGSDSWGPLLGGGGLGGPALGLGAVLQVDCRRLVVAVVHLVELLQATAAGADLRIAARADIRI